jgi:cytochrome P450
MLQIADGQLRLDMFERFIKESPTSVFSLPGGVSAILTQDPEAIRQSFNPGYPERQEGEKRAPLPNLVRSPLQEKMKNIAGKLLTQDNSQWRNLRLGVNESLHRDKIPQYIEMIVAKTQEACQKWEQQDPEREFDLKKNISELLREIALSTLMIGVEIPEELKPQISELIKVGVSVEQYRMIAPKALWKMIPGNKKYETLRKTVHESLGKVILQRATTPDQPQDILSSLVDQYKTHLSGAKDEEGNLKGLTLEETIQEFIGVFTAAHETTSHAMIWMFYELARHPEAYQKMHQEADQVLGTGDVDHHKLQGLTYARQAFMEALRLYPPVVAGLREVAVDFWEMTAEINGKLYTEVLPKGTWIFAYILGAQKDPKIWGDDAEKFRPERWKKGTITKEQESAFFAFGGGIHRCAGENFAINEGTLVAALIAQHFERIGLNFEDFYPGDYFGPTYEPKSTQMKTRSGKKSAINFGHTQK